MHIVANPSIQVLHGVMYLRSVLATAGQETSQSAGSAALWRSQMGRGGNSLFEDRFAASFLGRNRIGVRTWLSLGGFSFLHHSHHTVRITLIILLWASGVPDNPSAWSRLNLRFSLPPLAKRIVSCRRSRRFALSVAHLRHPPRLGADETQGTWAGTLSGDRERLVAAVGHDAFATRPAEGEASLFPVSANPWKP